MKNYERHIICNMLASNMRLHMVYFAGKVLNVELLPTDDVTVVRSDIPDDMFNYVLSAHFTEQNAGTRIEHIIRLFQERGLPFSWWLGESDTPVSLRDELSRQGLIFKEQDVGMVLDLEHFHPQATSWLNFKHVLQSEDLKDFGSIIHAIGGHLECYDRIYRNIPLDTLKESSQFEMYVAYLGKEPVATGILVLDGSMAGIYYIAVIPEQRGNGYGTSMMEYLLSLAKKKGYSLAGLEASHEGKSLYKRLGFNEICVFEEYGWRGL